MPTTYRVLIMTGTLLDIFLPVLPHLVHTTIPRSYSASEKLGELPSVTQVLSARAQVYGPNAKFKGCKHTFSSYVHQRDRKIWHNGQRFSPLYIGLWNFL